MILWRTVFLNIRRLSRNEAGCVFELTDTFCRLTARVIGRYSIGHVPFKTIFGTVDNNLQIERLLGGCLICGLVLMRVDLIKLVRRDNFVQSLLFFMNLAGRFHPVFGPILMVTYACLSNTLLLTGMLRLSSDWFSWLIAIYQQSSFRYESRNLYQNKPFNRPIRFYLTPSRP